MLYWTTIVAFSIVGHLLFEDNRFQARGETRYWHERRPGIARRRIVADVSLGAISWSMPRF